VVVKLDALYAAALVVILLIAGSILFIRFVNDERKVSYELRWAIAKYVEGLLLLYSASYIGYRKYVISQPAGES
jgi:hypothetical protein